MQERVVGQRAVSNLQYLVQMFGADTQLPKPCQVVDHAPLLGNPAVGDAATLRDFRTLRPVRQEIICLDTVDEGEVTGVPNPVERFHKMLFIVEPSRWSRLAQR
jgi:hypothetical protein